MHTVSSKLIILDRDGVINEDSDAFIKSPSEWVPLEGSIEAIAQLSQSGYRVAVATNQSGVARGLFDVSMLNAMHSKMHELVRQAGGNINLVLHCPHGPDAGCECRKPLPGMFNTIAERFSTRLEQTFAVGDSCRDLIAARAAGAKPVLVRTGKGLRTLASDCDLTDVAVYDSLATFVQELLND